MNPDRVSNFLEKDIFLKLKQYVESESNALSKSEYRIKNGRYDKPIFFEENLSYEIEKALTKELKSNYKVIFSQLIKYQIVDNVIPSLKIKKDKLPCDKTISLVISKNINGWALCVDHYIYDDEENSAIIFNSRTNYRHRPKYPSDNPEDYLLILLIHVAEENSWINKIPEKIMNLTSGIYLE